jgi:DNA-binding SARP family transcriptional activator
MTQAAAAINASFVGSPACLTFRLFGSLAILCDEQPLEVKSRKGVAILVYLVLQRRRQSRDYLAALLWPEADQARARANLRRALWTLNQTPLGAALSAGDDSVALAADRLVVDVVEFERLLARGPQDVPALEQAAALYDGDLLADFTLPGCGDFELWITGERERYRRRALETFHTLAEHHLGQHDFSAARRMARRQIAIDNLQEAAYQQLFRALAATGQRTTALSEFATLRALLYQELNVEPSPQTLTLIEQIRAAAAIEGRPPGKLATGPAPAAQPTARDLDRRPGRTGAVQQPAACPYRGLLSFREEDTSLFFGREDVVSQLVLAAQQHPFMAVVGPSGAGKSSVIRAGLIPALRRRGDWLVVSTRPGSRPFHELAASLLPLLTPDLHATEHLVEVRRLADALQTGQISLVDVLERLAHKQDAGRRMRVLLAVDHFAEAFSEVVDNSMSQGYIDALLQVVQSQPVAGRFVVVIALRADFLSQTMAYRPLTDAMTGSTVLLGPMTRAELTRAVVNPAHLRQVAFEPGLVERILRDVGSEPGSLPLLEFALAALWERQEAGQLTHAAYDEIGGVDAALARHAEAVIAELAPQDQRLAQRVFMQLVRPGAGVGDASRIATRSELGDAAWRLATRLADSRLLVTGSNASQQQTVEIIHDALIYHWDRLRTWIEEDRAFRLWQERLRTAMDTWEAQLRDEGALLRGSTLATAQAWKTERPDEIGQAEADYIAASVAFNMRRIAERGLERNALQKSELELAASRAKQRRLRALVLILVAALLVMVALWIAVYPW